MDHFHINTRYQLMGALMQEDLAEQVRCLRAYSRRLSAEILHEGANGFQPDGSTFHHNMHYFAYASYALGSLSTVIEGLSHTPFRVTPEAFARVKQAILAMRFTATRATCR